MTQRTLFVRLNIVDEDVYALARAVHEDLSQLGYDVVQVDVKDSDEGEVAFSSNQPPTPF